MAEMHMNNTLFPVSMSPHFPTSSSSPAPLAPLRWLDAMAGVFDIVSLVLGILGAIGLFQICYTYLYNRLPAQRFKVMEDVLEETQDLFRRNLEDGLFRDSAWVKKIERRLAEHRRTAQDLRSQVYRATTFRKQVRAMWQGLSKAINNLHSDIAAVRADVSYTSHEERKQWEREGTPVVPNLYAMALAAKARARKQRSRLIPSLRARDATLTSGITVHPPTTASSSDATETPSTVLPTYSDIPDTIAYPAPFRSSPGFSGLGSTNVDVDLSPFSQVPIVTDQRAYRVGDATSLPEPVTSRNQPSPPTHRVVNVDSLFKTIQKLNENVAVLTAAYNLRRTEPRSDFDAELDEKAALIMKSLPQIGSEVASSVDAGATQANGSRSLASLLLDKESKGSFSPYTDVPTAFTGDVSDSLTSGLAERNTHLHHRAT